MNKKKFVSVFFKKDSIGQFISKNGRMRCYSTAREVPKDRYGSKMLAWQIHSYGGLEELKLSESVRIPHIKGPNDVLIEISASSVNPIDVAMMGKRKW
jgi:hypothetical protein